MFVEYFYWHYVIAPGWLAKFFWNINRALLRFFSVPLMLRTLFAHWRRDITPYHGSLTTVLTAFAWNQISRGIGFVIRSLVLAMWAIAQFLYVLFVALFFVAFMAWPLIVVVGIGAGVVLLIVSAV